MIERVHSRKGRVVFKKNAIHLASIADPDREGQKWVEQYDKLLNRCSRVVVLGIGSGYHVKALRAQYPTKKILIVEPDLELAEAVQAEFGLDLVNVEILAGLTLVQLERHAIFQQVVRGLYARTRHAPSFQVSHDYLTQVEDLLVGRMSQGMRFLAEQRPEFAEILSADHLVPVSTTHNERLLNIKIMKERAMEASTLNPEVMMKLCALGELVA